MNQTNPILTDILNTVQADSTKQSASQIMSASFDIFKTHTLPVIIGLGLVVVIIVVLLKQWLDVAEGNGQNFVFNLAFYIILFLAVFGVMVFLSTTTGIGVIEKIKFW